MKQGIEKPGLEKLNSILDEIRSVDDRDLKFDLLVEFSERFQEVPSSIAARPFPESHKAPACESEAYGWVVPTESGNGKIYFAVENPQGISAKAFAVILEEGLSGGPLEDMKKISEEIVYDVFGRGVSMGKGQGLMGMVKVVKELAKR